MVHVPCGHNTCLQVSNPAAPDEGVRKDIMSYTIEEIEKELYEKLAEIEHERWADWQKYLHSKLRPAEDKRNYMIMFMDDYNHWERQINTNYSDLSEEEKNSDRQQVDRYWNYISSLISKLKKLKLAKEVLEKYASNSSWGEEYIGGPRLNFTTMDGEGFEIAKQALEEIEK
jgi:hypothetical protein